jgi:hypothetical protein
MKKTTSSSTLRFALFAAAGAAACAWAPQAAADDAVPAELGTQADVGGGQQWTVTGLQPSADQIAAAPAGSLWEATATATPAQGGIPVLPGFAARTPAGEDYPVMWNVPTPLGINPAPLPAGESTTGKLYFDVTGAAPDSVTYTRDGQDVAVWVQPPPPATDAAAAYGSGGGASAYVPPVQAAPAPMTVAPAAAPAPAAPAAPAPAAAGSSGTPAPAAVGTPAPATTGSSGTPQPATGSVGTPATPGSTTATPSPATPSPATPSPASAAAATPTQGSTSPAAGTAPAGETPAPAAVPTTPPPAGAALPTTGSSGTTFTVPMTTPAPAPAGQ